MTRKILAIAMVLLLALAAAPMGASADYVQTLNAGGSLNLRQGPGKEYGVEGYVVDGDEITLTGNSDVDWEGYTWVEVVVTRTGKVGYIKEMYVVSSWEPSYVANQNVHIANGTSIILRGGPGTGYAINGYVYEGDRITLLSSGSVWSKVRLFKNGAEGYIKNKYIYGFTGGSSGGSSGGSGDSSASGVAVIATANAGSRVNVRTGPSTGYKVVTQLMRGASVTITGKSGNWYKVSTGTGYVGYVYKDYLSFVDTSYVTGAVNLRSGPGMGYGVYLVIPKYATVTVLGVSGSWTKVSYNGYVGYVYSTYVKDRVMC